MTDPPDDHREREPLLDLESLMALINRSDYRDEISDVPRRRQRIFEALARSEDPTWREIGEQLRDGRMELRDVMRVDTYWQKVRQGLAENQDAFRETVAEATRQLQQEEADRRGPDR